MTYLPPSVVLSRLSEFTSDTVIGGIGEGSKFVRAQVGSMSSTLGFLSQEIARQDEALLEQREALLDALDDVENLGDNEVSVFVADQRDTVENIDPRMGNTEEVQSVLLDAMGDLQTAINDGTFEEDTAEARGVLYDLFETRVQSQLWVLGRDR